jgi:hypothetical protein
MIECIIGCFPIELTRFIVDYCISYFSDFLSFKEGYFLIRVIIKSAKCELLQKKVVSLLIENLKNFHKCHNWSLISQCVIYNFPIKNFKYEKSCSKHVNSDDFIIENELDYDNKNKYVYKFISSLFKNISLWEEKQFIPLIECALKIAKVSFQKLFVNYLSQSERRDLLLDFFFLSWNGFDIIRLFLNTLDRSTIDTFIDYFHKYFKLNKNEISRYDDWLDLLRLYPSIKEKKQSISSKNSQSTNNTLSHSNLHQQVNYQQQLQLHPLQQNYYYPYPYSYVVNRNTVNDLNCQYYPHIFQAPTNIQSYPAMISFMPFNYNEISQPTQFYIPKS